MRTMICVFLVCASLAVGIKAQYQLAPVFGKSLTGNHQFAFQYCQTIGKQLPTPDTKQKFDKLVDFMKANGLKVTWTSGSDLAVSNVWTWLTTSQPFTFQEWHTNQPDNTNNNEHCVDVWLYGGKYKLNDRPCSQKLIVVCEEATCFKARKPCYEC